MYSLYDELNYTLLHTNKCHTINIVNAAVIRPYMVEKAKDQDEYRQYLQHVIYWKGYLDRANSVDAFDYLIDKSKQGDYYASAALGVYYLSENMIQQHFYEGKKYFDLAIEQGCGYAALYFYVEYVTKEEIQIPITEAQGFEYLKKAAELNCKDAKELLKSKEKEISIREEIDTLSKHLDNVEKGVTVSPSILKVQGYCVQEDFSGQTYYKTDLGGAASEPVEIPAVLNCYLKDIIEAMEKIARANHIPVTLLPASVIEGGAMSRLVSKMETGDWNNGGGRLVKNQHRAIIARHPNPPQSYCNLLIVFRGDMVQAYFTGASKAFSENNAYDSFMRGDFGSVGFLSKMKISFGIRPDESKLEEELQWHASIYQMFCELFV